MRPAQEYNGWTSDSISAPGNISFAVLPREACCDDHTAYITVFVRRPPAPSSLSSSLARLPPLVGPAALRPCKGPPCRRHRCCNEEVCALSEPRSISGRPACRPRPRTARPRARIARTLTRYSTARRLTCPMCAAIPAPSWTPCLPSQARSREQQLPRAPRKTNGCCALCLGASFCPRENGLSVVSIRGSGLCAQHAAESTHVAAQTASLRTGPEGGSCGIDVGFPFVQNPSFLPNTGSYSISYGSEGCGQQLVMTPCFDNNDQMASFMVDGAESRTRSAAASRNQASRASCCGALLACLSRAAAAAAMLLRRQEERCAGWLVVLVGNSTRACAPS